MQSSVLEHFQKVEDVEEQEIQWVIPRWIPKGGITLLVGDGGIGKTNLWSYLVSRLSAGLPTMLDNEEVEREAGPGNVAVLDIKNGVLTEKINTTCIYFSKEDSTAKRLKKNFEMYDANMESIGTVDVEHLAGFTYKSQDLDELIDRERPALVVFDPIQAFFPNGASMTSRQQSRQVLDHLVRLAQEFDTAFLLVCHTNKKKTEDWRQRFTGSADLADIARSVIYTAYTEMRLKTGERVRYISNEKNSYAKQEMTVLYVMKDDGRIEFAGMSEKRFADYVADEGKRTKEAAKPRGQKEICREMILKLLKGGEAMPVKELNEALEAAGIGRKAIDVTKTELEHEGIIVRRRGNLGSTPRWMIALSQSGEGEAGGEE
ncbi:MAG: AAA family ATPase [Lachnospiraceae bacterium]|nr:AAA family ATPase [Lachnospiraceae bacterium]